MMSWLGEPKAIWIETDSHWKAMVIKDERWEAPGVELWLRENQNGTGLAVSAPQLPLKRLRLCWNHPLGNVAGLRILGDHWERAYGDLEWRGIHPERVLPWYFLMTQGASSQAVGVMTGAGAFCSWQVNGEQIVFTADLRCGDSGVLLKDRVLEVATLVGRTGRSGQSAFSLATEFCVALCPRPLLPKGPIVGGNNWYYAYGRSDHEKILADSRFIAELADGHATRPFMVIDDGWQLTSGGGSCNGGPWVGNRLFPDMARLAEEMKQTGVRPGIWFRPLLASQNVPDEWIRFRRPGGQAVLDPSVPAVGEYVAQTIRDLSAWGYDMIKHDFSTFDVLGRWGFQMGGEVNSVAQPLADRSRTTAEILVDFYRTIQEASGKSLILGCNTVGHLAAGLVEIQRTGDDTSGRSWERTRRMGINTLSHRMPQHNTFFCADADCVGVTDQVPWELNRQWLELLSRSSTALFVSAEPSQVTAIQKQDLKVAFQTALQGHPPAEPLDWMETTCPTHWQLGGEVQTFSWNHRGTPGLGEQDNEWWL